MLKFPDASDLYGGSIDVLDRTQLAIDLVHGIDALEAERARLLEPLDAKIRKAKEDLAVLMGGRMPRVTATPGRKRGVGKQLCDLIVETPDAPPGIRAMQIYGEDTAESRAKLRTLLRNLKRSGYVRRAEGGRWEVIPEEDGETFPEPVEVST